MKRKSLQSILCAFITKKYKETKAIWALFKQQGAREYWSMALESENNRKINWTKSRFFVIIKNIGRILHDKQRDMIYCSYQEEIVTITINPQTPI